MQAASGGKDLAPLTASKEVGAQPTHRGAKLYPEADSAPELPGKSPAWPPPVRPAAKDPPRYCAQTSHPQNCDVTHGRSFKQLTEW